MHNCNLRRKYFSPSGDRTSAPKITGGGFKPISTHSCQWRQQQQFNVEWKFARVGEPSPMFINLLDSMMLHDVFLFVLFALYFAKKAHKDTSAGLYTPLPKECSRKFISRKVFSSQLCTTMENSRSPEQSAHRALFAFSISIRKPLLRRRDKHWVARQKDTQNSCVYAEFVFSSERTFNFCRNSCTWQPLGACLHTTPVPSDKIRVIDMHDGEDGGSLKPLFRELRHEVWGSCGIQLKRSQKMES